MSKQIILKSRAREPKLNQIEALLINLEDPILCCALKQRYSCYR